MNYRIGIDLDGILADFMQYWSSLIRSMYRDTELPQLTHADALTYDLQRYYPDLRGRIKAVRHIFYQTPNVWEYMPSLLSATQWGRLGQLMRGRWEFHFITARPISGRGDSVEVQTRRWLEKHLLSAMPLGVGCGPIHVHSAPHNEPGPQKPEVCHTLGVPWMIDEHPDAVQALADGGIQVIMQVYNYNIGIEHPRVWRAKDFNTILDFLEALA